MTDHYSILNLKFLVQLYVGNFYCQWNLITLTTTKLKGQLDVPYDELDIKHYRILEVQSNLDNPNLNNFFPPFPYPVCPLYKSNI